MNTHVYLDVDGVLNAVTGKSDPGWGWPESCVVRVNGFQIRYSPTMVDALNDLSERITFHWLTTWREDARDLARQIGLRGEQWEVLDAPEFFGGKWGWWKLRALREHLDHTKPDMAFWIDDDIAFDDDARAWLETVPHVVPICPRSEVGLTADHVRLATEAVA